MLSRSKRLSLPTFPEKDIRVAWLCPLDHHGSWIEVSPALNLAKTKTPNMSQKRDAAAHHGGQKPPSIHSMSCCCQNPNCRGVHIPRHEPGPCAMSNPMYKGSPVFLHPQARMAYYGSLDAVLDESQKRPTTKGVPTNFEAEHQLSVPPSNNIDTDAHISLAARQLKAQIDEFIRIYDGFYQLYEKEVAQIKSYVDDEVLQRAWLKKIEYNEKFNTGQDQENQQLSTQRKLLAACLSHLNGAAPGGTTPISTDPAIYDRRGIYLQKIRAAGQRVLHLAEKTMTSRAACKDLRAELLDLGKLVDPKGKETKLLYRFDKRETVKKRDGVASEDAGNDGNDGGDGNAEEKQDEDDSHGTGWSS